VKFEVKRKLKIERASDMLLFLLCLIWLYLPLWSEAIMRTSLVYTHFLWLETSLQKQEAECVLFVSLRAMFHGFSTVNVLCSLHEIVFY